MFDIFLTYFGCVGVLECWRIGVRVVVVVIVVVALVVAVVALVLVVLVVIRWVVIVL